MNKKLNNKLLIGILVVLGLIFFGTNYLKTNNSKTILKTNIVDIDTAKVSKILIKKGVGNGQDISFFKKSKSWEVSQEAITSKVSQTNMKGLLNLLKQFKIERLVAKSEDKWDSYQLKDSTSTKVTIEEKSNAKTTVVYLGKIKYDQPNNQYNRYGVKGSTYVRLNNDPKVYAVRGTLSSTFNRDFNSWRNSDFLKVNKTEITKIQFDYPKDKGYTLVKNDEDWTIDGSKTDSTKVTKYLNKLSFKSNSNFADNFTPISQPSCKLKIEGNNMNETVIEAYKDSINEKFYLKSTLNPDVFFESDSTGLFKELFVSKNSFIN